MSRTVSTPDAAGHFGPYGGRYVPETLMEPLRESNQLTHWVMDDIRTPAADDTEDGRYVLFLRPLFPGEEPCADPAY